MVGAGPEPKGPALMVSGYLSFGLAPVLARAAMVHGWRSIDAVVFRFALALALTVLIAWSAQRWGAGPWREEMRFEARNWRALGLRAVFGAVAACCFFGALALVGAALGTLLNYTYTLFGSLLAVALLGHRPPMRSWAYLLLSVLGLVLVIGQPSGQMHGPRFALGVGLGLAAGLFGGLSNLSIKQLRQTDNALTINAIYSAVALAFALALAPLLPGGPTTTLAMDAGAWALMILSAIFSFGGQVLVSHGFKGATVQEASILALLAPVLSVTGAHWILGEALSPHFFAGAALVLLCAILDAGSSRGLAMGLGMSR